MTPTGLQRANDAEPSAVLTAGQVLFVQHCASGDAHFDPGLSISKRDAVLVITNPGDALDGATLVLGDGARLESTRIEARGRTYVSLDQFEPLTSGTTEVTKVTVVLGEQRWEVVVEPGAP